MFFRIFAVNIFFVFAFFVSCQRNHINANIVIGKENRLTSQNISVKKEKPTKGEILENNHLDWNSKSVVIGKNNKIAVFNFIDENKGWGVNENFVFKTTDSGKIWKSFSIQFVGKAKICSVNFVDENNGWLILQVGDRNEYSKENQVLIYRSQDGGKSWTHSHTEKSVLLNDFQFTIGDGWVIATRFLGLNPQRLEPLILHFSGETGVWNDVSEPLKLLSNEPTYGEDSLPSLESLAIDENNCLLAVNKAEKIFQTCDRGRNWQIITTIGNFSPLSSYGMKQIDVSNDFIWTLQSAGGIEGTASTISIIYKKASEKTKVISFSDYFAKQGISLSEKEFFISGEKIVLTQRKKKNGIILNTTDSGVTWKNIFKTNKEIASTQFMMPLLNTIWILTAEGELNKITKKNSCQRVVIVTSGDLGKYFGANT
jgi:hypothetical protein